MLEAHHWIAARSINPNRSTKSTKCNKKEYKMPKKRKKTETYFEDWDST